MLVNYESSDDEDPIPQAKPDPALALGPSDTSIPHEKTTSASGPINGPSQGPTGPPVPPDETEAQDATPGSPYTANRALIQNLTLPTVPNFSIPPSPPGSPPQRATKKFAQFLELKTKQGQHFNQRLGGSSVLRDPSHSQRLFEFAGITEHDQYASTLSEGVAVPVVFPDHAYVEELRASQKRILKEKEQQKSRTPREAVEFVSATRSGTSSGTGTPSGTGAVRSSAAERVMAGLDRESSTSYKRKDLEHRSRDSSESRSRRRSRSRSPKRKRP